MGSRSWIMMDHISGPGGGHLGGYCGEMLD